MTNKMEQFKRAKVIMLFISRNSGCLTQNRHTLRLNISGSASTSDNRHLYIISDEEIKEGDFMIAGINNRIVRATDCGLKNDILSDNTQMAYFKGDCKKIIATTDTNLILDVFDKKTCKGNKDCSKHCDCFTLVHKGLPQPSQQFIEKYIEEYNKGEIITDVLVEYEIPYDSDQLNHENGDWSKYYSIYEESNSYKIQQYEDVIEWSFNEGKKHLQLFSKLKINPKDNTITIKKIKDSWNREELRHIIDFIKELTNDDLDRISPNLKTKAKEKLKWIEENL